MGLAGFTYFLLIHSHQLRSHFLQSNLWSCRPVDKRQTSLFAANQLPDSPMSDKNFPLRIPRSSEPLLYALVIAKSTLSLLLFQLCGQSHVCDWKEGTPASDACVMPSIVAPKYCLSFPFLKGSHRPHYHERFPCIHIWFIHSFKHLFIEHITKTVN